MTQYSGVVIHSVKDMAKELNLALDNMDIDCSETAPDDTLSSHSNEIHPCYSIDNGSSLIYPSEEDVPEGSIEMDILHLVSDHNGVSFMFFFATFY